MKNKMQKPLFVPDPIPANFNSLADSIDHYYTIHRPFIGKSLLALSGAALLENIINHKNGNRPTIPSAVAPTLAVFGAGVLLDERIDIVHKLLDTIDLIASNNRDYLEDISDELDLYDDDDDDDDEVEEIDPVTAGRFKLEKSTANCEFDPPARSFWKDIEVDEDTPAPSSFVGTSEEWSRVSLNWKRYFVMLQRISDNSVSELASVSEGETTYAADGADVDTNGDEAPKENQDLPEEEN